MKALAEVRLDREALGLALTLGVSAVDMWRPGDVRVDGGGPELELRWRTLHHLDPVAVMARAEADRRERLEAEL
jgi:hypothetical protein